MLGPFESSTVRSPLGKKCISFLSDPLEEHSDKITSKINRVSSGINSVYSKNLNNQSQKIYPQKIKPTSQSQKYPTSKQFSPKN